MAPHDAFEAGFKRPTAARDKDDGHFYFGEDGEDVIVWADLEDGPDEPLTPEDLSDGEA